MIQSTVVAIGEVLIDFIAKETGDLVKVKEFQKFPGGAPANFIVGLARLGVSTTFIGKVGDDSFGNFLIDCLEKEGVGTTTIIKSQEKRTTLAFVSLDENGGRDFIFYRKHCADIDLRFDELNLSRLPNVKYLHFGTVSLTDNPSRETTLEVIRYFKKLGAKICFDPNIREDLWKEKDLLLNVLNQALELTDIFYPSREELCFIIGENEFEEQEAIDKLFEQYPLDIIALKKGSEGCLIKKRDDFFLTIPSFETNIIDTTGAGDGFNAGFIFGLLNEKSLEESGILGNAVGSLVIQKKGAMTALPTKEELIDFLNKQKIYIHF
ncbi:MAG: carbohydrate kinase [Asgard group archaeon]|nr:carbohydrate kinase [Asgard group archaeon]